MSGGGIREALGEQAARLGAEVGEAQLDTLAEHFQLVRKWNPAAGLTSARGEEGAAAHYAEAFQILDQFETGREDLLVDLGSGGGFPGLVLAVLRPSWHVWLVERGARKAAFLQEAACRLRLPKVSVMEKNLRRAEDFPGDRPFERLTAKAVGQFPLTLDLLVRRGAPSSRAVLLTGEAGRREIEQELLRRGHEPQRRSGALPAPPPAPPRVTELRRLAGRRQSFAIIVSRSPTL